MNPATAEQNRPASTSMPTLAQIAEAWDGLAYEVLETVFPRVRILSIGIGEPVCFRCGWLSPTPDAASFKPRKGDEEGVRRAWKAAVGWLERCHLQDRARGGGNHPLNIVPLCPLCHDEQGMCDTREKGIAFVNTEPPFKRFVALTQHYTDIACREIRNPSRPYALNRLLRAQSNVAMAWAERAEARLEEIEGR